MKFNIGNYFTAENGKKFIISQPLSTVFCAYCGFVQGFPLRNFERDKEGLITFFEVEMEEHHSSDCKQK